MHVTAKAPERLLVDSSGTVGDLLSAARATFSPLALTRIGVRNAAGEVALLSNDFPLELAIADDDHVEAIFEERDGVELDAQDVEMLPPSSEPAPVAGQLSDADEEKATRAEVVFHYAFMRNRTQDFKVALPPTTTLQEFVRKIREVHSVDGTVALDLSTSSCLLPLRQDTPSVPLFQVLGTKFFREAKQLIVSERLVKLAGTSPSPTQAASSDAHMRQPPSRQQVSFIKRVNVRPMTGRNIVINGQGLTDVASLKEAVHKEMPGTPTEQMRLVWGGRQLNDTEALSDFPDMGSEPVIHLLLRLQDTGVSRSSSGARVEISKADSTEDDLKAFEVALSWKPVSAATVGDTAVAQFLCCLYAMTRRNTDTGFQDKLLAILWHESRSEPACAALTLLFEREKIRASLKAALIASCMAMFTSFLGDPLLMAQQILDQSRAGFEEWERRAHLLPTSFQNSLIVTLVSGNCTCNHSKLTSPVRIRRADGTLSPLFSRQAIVNVVSGEVPAGIALPQHRGLAAEITAAVAAGSPLQLIDDTAVSMATQLLTDSDLTAVPVFSYVDGSPFPEFPHLPAAELRLNCDKPRSIYKVVNAVQLLQAGKFSLTLASNKHLTVWEETGGSGSPDPVLFDPLTGKSEQTSIDRVAMHFGHDDFSGVTEAIFVLLDCSRSMSLAAGFEGDDAAIHQHENSKIAEFNERYEARDLPGGTVAPFHLTSAQQSEWMSVARLVVLKNIHHRPEVEQMVAKVIRYHGPPMARTLAKHARDQLLSLIRDGYPSDIPHTDWKESGGMKDDEATAFVVSVPSFGTRVRSKLTLRGDRQNTVHDLMDRVCNYFPHLPRMMECHRSYADLYNIYVGGKRIDNDLTTLASAGIVEDSEVVVDLRTDSPVSGNVIPLIFQGANFRVSVYNSRDVTATWLHLLDAVLGHGPPEVVDIVCSRSLLWADLAEADGARSGQLLENGLNPRFMQNRTLEVGSPNGISFSSSMPTSVMSRMTTTKQLVHAFCNRARAFDLPTALGLVTFDSTATVSCPLTRVAERFRVTVDRSQPKGDTSLYDAMEVARQELRKFIAQHPECKGRILVLSDGEDTSSRLSDLNITQSLVKDSILVDAVLIGKKSKNAPLHALSLATGGVSFHPKVIGDAVRVVEQETMVSSLQRRESASKVPAGKKVTRGHLNVRGRMPFNSCDFSSLRDHHLAPVPLADGESASRLLSIARALQTDMGAEATVPCIQRLLDELVRYQKNPHPNADCYPCEADLRVWKVVMEGGGNYVGGVFELYIAFPDTYPMNPPQVRFLTKIRHANVSPQGRVCHSLLAQNWTASTSVREIIDAVYGLLLTPSFDSVLDTELAEQFKHGDGSYEATVLSAVEEHAQTVTREDIRQQAVPPSAEPLSHVQRQMPEYFRCPISHEILVDPVKTPLGITYSRHALHQYLQTHGHDPAHADLPPDSRPPLSMQDCVVDEGLAQLLLQYATN